MIHQITSVISNSLSTFYRHKIENNGKIEACANYILQGMPFLFESARKVELIDLNAKIYENKKKDETFVTTAIKISVYASLAFFPVYFIYLTAIVAINILLGTSLKLAGWVLNRDSFHSNRKLYQILRSENEPLQKKLTFSPLLVNDIAKTQNELSMGTISLPKDMIREISKNFDKPLDLYNFMRTSRSVFLTCQKEFEYLNNQERLKLVEKQFPEEISNKIKQMFTNNSCPLIKLRAHKVSSDLHDYRVQPLLGDGIQGGDDIFSKDYNISCLKPSELKNFSLVVGFEPIPFIAVRAIHRRDDKRPVLGKIHKLFFNLGIANNRYLEQDITIMYHRRGQKNWGISTNLWATNGWCRTIARISSSQDPLHSWFMKLINGEEVVDLHTMSTFLPAPDQNVHSLEFTPT